MKPAAKGGIFAVPILIAASSSVALVAGLLGTGVFDIVAWTGLALPVVTFLWAWNARKQRR